MNNKNANHTTSTETNVPPPKAYSPKTKPDTKNRYKFARFYCSLEDFAEYVRIHTERGTLLEYAYILHDKDVYDEDEPNRKFWMDESRSIKAGDPKKPHIHAIFYWSSNVFDGGRKTDFNSFKLKQDDGNPAVCTFCETPDNKQTCYDYLLHLNAPTKHQYDENQLYQSSGAPRRFHVSNTNTDDNVTYVAFTDFVYGERDLDSMVKIYGKDFLYHYHSFKEIRKDIDRSKDVDYLNEIQKGLYKEVDELTKKVEQLENALAHSKRTNKRLINAFEVLKEADPDAYDCLCLYCGGDIV